MVPTIEIISINDKEAEDDKLADPHAPNEELVIQQIELLFKSDPLNQYLGITKLLAFLKQKNENWILSEKKLKSIMKNNNLNNQQQQDQYLDQIEYSKNIPNLPKSLNLNIKFNNLKGYSIHSNKIFKENQLILTELKPLIFIPQLDHLELTKKSKACTYCGSLIDNSLKKDSFLNNLDCNKCNEIWCSIDCKNDDKLHINLKHESLKSNHFISVKDFKIYIDFCFNNGILQDFYSIAIIKANFKFNNELESIFFNNFAKINESIRYKIKHPNLLIENDEIYLKGFELFNKIFINDEISFENFTLMLGIFNLNNYQGSIFKIQSILNHDCDNNIKIDIIDNKLNKGLKLYSTKKINLNDELVINYINPNLELNNRLKFLRLNYGFICHCLKCQSDNNSIQRRKSSNTQHLNTLQEFKNFIKNNKNDLNEFDLSINEQDDNNETERRKSVRFNEKVTAVTSGE